MCREGGIRVAAMLTNRVFAHKSPGTPLIFVRVMMLISGSNYKDVRWGVKFVYGNVGFMNNVLTVPQWCAFLLPRYLDELRNAAQESRR